MLANVLRQPLRQIFQEIHLQREALKNRAQIMEDVYKGLEERGEIKRKLEVPTGIKGTAGGLNVQSMARCVIHGLEYWLICWCCCPYSSIPLPTHPSCAALSRLVCWHTSCITQQWMSWRLFALQ